MGSAMEVILGQAHAAGEVEKFQHHGQILCMHFGCVIGLDRSPGRLCRQWIRLMLFSNVHLDAVHSWLLMDCFYVRSCLCQRLNLDIKHTTFILRR
jgi:hypothetical protein